MGVTVSEALSLAVNSAGDARTPINEPVHLLIADALFRIANSPDPKKKGSVNKAILAQKMILDRLVGKRVAGTSPAVRQQAKISFVDLTVAGIAGADE